jgi:pimeloyl-ACP methyl ester carboxylesterase
MADQRIAVVNGIRLSYEVAGDPAAPPMVLLHGLGERASDWGPVAPGLAGRYSVYAVDMRGHGDSDWPGSYSLELMRDDVIAFLSHLGLRNVILAGHSMGGLVAYLVVLARPDLVGRLIVEDAPPPFPRDKPVRDRPGGPLPFDWLVVPAIVGQASAGDPAVWELLKTITAPALLIGGGPGSSMPQDKIAEAAARIPACDLATIQAGHHVHTSQPEAFASAVLAWLDGDGGRQAV